jgi:glycopeptide antibiotics resistance protein
LIFGGKKTPRYILGLLLTEYLVVLLSSTVFFRTFKKHNSGHNFNLLWSYDAISEGGERLVLEIIMNVVVFVPVGMLLPCAFRSMTWWKVVLIGGGISTIIELLQLLYKRGFSEVDDVMHNTIGCLMGYGIYSLARYGYERMGKRSVGVL